MRHYRRPKLNANQSAQLAKKQRKVDSNRKAGNLDTTKTWKTARKTKLLKEVLRVLQAMAGARERCMYCSDSHGTDIEHWRPKASHPEVMFAWSNMLLCCTECGRIKSDKFPVDSQGQPLLIDPSLDNPWDHLDFDPLTGILTARFDLGTQVFDARGQATVQVLQFELREAMQRGFRASWKRIAAVCESARQSRMGPQQLTELLRAADDHGLLEWCFSSRGSREPPLSDLLQEQPDVFTACQDILNALTC
ncbi:MAG: hypothetical protein H6835_04565 [Planctomycetes bacterium]|nr:hypothetical protein [Planctomycetota bacterium]